MIHVQSENDREKPLCKSLDGETFPNSRSFKKCPRCEDIVISINIGLPSHNSGERHDGYLISFLASSDTVISYMLVNEY